MILLGVNIDHVATLRQARYARTPDSPMVEPCVVEAALDARNGGADSLTIHVRGDRRHMQVADAYRLRQDVPLPLNLEMGVTEELVKLALDLRPRDVCMVPESREEITTEGGLDLLRGWDAIRIAIDRLRNSGIRVSLFIDPEQEQVEAAAKLGAEMVELHTGSYANAAVDGVDAEWDKLLGAADHGHALGLQINAGHGINYHNIMRIRELPHLRELNIGHSIVSRALRVGMESAVREMKHAMKSSAA